MWERKLRKSIPPLFFVFLGLHPQQTEVPMLGLELELQLLASTRATATQDLDHIFDLCHRLWQHWILNPPSKAMDRNCFLMDTSWIRFHYATVGTLGTSYFNFYFPLFSTFKPEKQNYGLKNVVSSSQIPMLKPNSQCEGIWRYFDK